MMDIIVFLMRHSVLLFGGPFLLILALTFWPGRRAGFEHDANIPLRDDK